MTLATGLFQVDTDRDAVVGSLSRHTEADYRARADSAAFSGRYRAARSPDERWTIGPLGSLAYTRLDRGDFTETGAGSVSLALGHEVTESLLTVLGAEITGQLSTSGGREVQPRLVVGWQHEFLDRRGDFTARFAGAAGGPFTVRGFTMDRDRALVGVDLVARAGAHWRLRAGYHALLGPSQSEHAVTAGAHWRW